MLECCYTLPVKTMVCPFSTADATKFELSAGSIVIPCACKSCKVDELEIIFS